MLTDGGDVCHHFYDASAEKYHPLEFTSAYRAQSYDFKELVFSDLQPILTCDKVVSAIRRPAETRWLSCASCRSFFADHIFSIIDHDRNLICALLRPTISSADGTASGNTEKKNKAFHRTEICPKQPAVAVGCILMLVPATRTSTKTRNSRRTLGLLLPYNQIQMI